MITTVNTTKAFRACSDSSAVVYARCAVLFTTASTMAAGCTTLLSKGQHLGMCKLVGKPPK